ncbi:unnamed protein product [Cuscuta epithymum]|uniref:Uncharacterized protein n=1 Tax=Cuscuta epithymum TaxID=186058 RepID=A0AAV0EIL7_9ASTE|nr:unnamed protein product [Cuscuta epithymum]
MGGQSGALAISGGNDLLKCVGSRISMKLDDFYTYNNDMIRIGKVKGWVQQTSLTRTIVQEHDDVELVADESFIVVRALTFNQPKSFDLVDSLGRTGINLWTRCVV